MSTLQIAVLFALTAGAIGCLLGIYKAIQRLSEALFLIRTELTKVNSKLERIEVVHGNSALKPFGPFETDPVFEAAIDDAFEKMQTGIERTVNSPK